LLVEGVEDYAICMLNPAGRVISWNSGAQHVTGFAEDQIAGEDFARFYTHADIKSDKPNRELILAAETSRFQVEDWRVRYDGTCFWAEVVITALRDSSRNLRGFCHVTRDMTHRKRGEWLEGDRRQILEMVAQNQSLPEVLTRITRMFERQYPESIACVLMLKDGKLEDAIASNLPQSFVDAMCNRSLAITDGLSNATGNKDNLIVSDVLTDPLWAELRD